MAWYAMFALQREFTCWCAVKGISATAQSTLDLSGVAMPSVTQALHGEDCEGRCVVAAKVISAAVQASPDLAWAVMPVLLLALEDEYCDVRKCAV